MNEFSEMSGAGHSGAAPAGGARGMSLLALGFFDIGGPLAVYYGMSSAGLPAVVALVVSGVLPALGIALNVVRRRHIDAIGIVVLFGILLGAVVGLASGSARLVLIDGTVPTAVLAAACFGSLVTARPFMFRVAQEFMGTDSPRGREFASMWQHPGFRHAFSVITMVWGATFLTETAAQIVIIEVASINISKMTSNVMPIVVAAVVMGWTGMYGRWQQARSEGHQASA